MRRCVALLGLLVLAGCNDGPQLGLGVNVGPNGVSVSPTVSGNVGGVNVGVAGQGVDL
ncbi:MAG: hypothetical protein ACRCS3_04935 [Paracoccaceae bacterium]